MNSSLKKYDLTAFKPGESQTLSFGYGYVTDTAKQLTIYFPVSKIMTDVSSVSITSASFTISMRHCGGGYIKSSGFDLVGVSGLTVTASIEGGCVAISAVSTTNNYWGITNNTPFAGFASGTVTFS